MKAECRLCKKVFNGKEESVVNRWSAHNEALHKENLSTHNKKKACVLDIIKR